MKTKAATTDPKERKAYRQYTGTMSLGLVFSIIGIVTTLSIVGLSTYFYRSFNQINDQYNLNQTRQLAVSYAGSLENFNRRYTRSLELIATDPEIARALQDNNTAAIARIQNKLSLQFPYAYRVRLFNKGLGKPDYSMDPPLSEACLYLKQLSASGKPPFIDIHGSPILHIDVLRRVPSEQGKTAGYILLTLKMASIDQIIKRFRAQGYIELRQKSLNSYPLITSFGNKNYRDSAKPYKTRVADTAWFIYFWPKPLAFTISTGAQLIFVIVVAGIILLLTLLVFYLYRVISVRMLKDQSTFVHIMKDIRDGELADSYPAFLKNFQSIISELMRMAHEVIKVQKKKVAEHQSTSQVNPAAVGISEADEDLNGLELSLGELQQDDEEMIFNASNIPLDVFRAYDIRGIVDKQLTNELVYEIGRAIGSEAYKRGEDKVVVGRDGRLSGPALSDALSNGIMATGIDVVDIGQVATPVLYFATQMLSQGSGVMITGSHNPPEYNGLKIMLRGDTLYGETITALATRIQQQDLIEGTGNIQCVDIVKNYISQLVADVTLEKKPKIVIDCGNGVAGDIAPEVLKQLGCEVLEMYCEVDGNFPNHHPDPSKLENIAELRKAVVAQGADLGVAFDGDGDRLGVVDCKGNVIWPDRVMMILAEDVLRRNAGATVIYDVKCTRNIKSMIEQYGGKPLMWKTGHSFIKAKMKETGALLAGEMSGHLFIKERWYGFDDAIYACARLLEALGKKDETSAEVFSALPDTVNTPEINILMQEGETGPLMDTLIDQAEFGQADIITLDGIRVEFADGWGLIRASNTTPSLVLRFEADDEQSLTRIQNLFRKNLAVVAPNLKLPF
ncbi:Phosphoglucomutase @ Phosphomannomutase [hydrothermal vent metagenome]|uniref:Phosphoglucomutase @ Phosphomannomutase n=1 Tax=hydrothermal vent metagenome TaxID=652676 RepID=A0A3B0YAY2_9ZZZZ